MGNNSAPQVKESQSLETGNTQKFMHAIDGRKIANAEVEDLKEVLRLIMVKIGLRANNWPKDEEKIILVQFIAENYGGHTAAEIKLAFDLAVVGKLGVDWKCYENFSCGYFAEIMNSYRVWALDSYKQVEKPEPMPTYSDDDIDNCLCRNAQEAYVKFILGKLYNPPEMYLPILVKDGLLHEQNRVIDYFRKCASFNKTAIYQFYEGPNVNK